MRYRIFACCHARKTAVTNWLISGWPDIEQRCAAPRFQACLRRPESGIYSAASINAGAHEGKLFVPRELVGWGQLGACWKPQRQFMRPRIVGDDVRSL